MASKNKKNRRKKKRNRSMADRADRHVLYQLAVQSPEPDIEFFEKAYRHFRQAEPLSMREDFCGTALLSTEWARSDKQRTALGVDLDGPTLAWARQTNVGAAKPGVQRRVELIEADVRDIREPRVDLTCALNFSFCVFKEREELKRYFRVVYEGLKDDGVFVTELYGGTEAIIELEDDREIDGEDEVEDFTYTWEQESYDPLTHETLCHIHFEFEDGSVMKNAFTYDWRLWTVPEVRDLLTEVGFQQIAIYWEDVDDEGEGTGEYRLAEIEENQEGWIVYIVAAK